LDQTDDVVQAPLGGAVVLVEGTDVVVDRVVDDVVDVGGDDVVLGLAVVEDVGGVVVEELGRVMVLVEEGVDVEEVEDVDGRLVCEVVKTTST
jgi:hypothetical protein